MLKSQLVILVVPIIAAGCATVPKVSVNYYWPKAETQIQVAQTINCAMDDKKKWIGLQAGAALTAPATTYSSDPASVLGTLNYQDFNGDFSDVDVNVSFTDDGRLSAINSTSTGQADTIVKDFVALAQSIPLAMADAFSLMSALDLEANKGTQSAKNRVASINKACDLVKQYGSRAGDTKPYSVVLTYTATQKYPHGFTTGTLAIAADSGSKELYEKLLKLYPAAVFRAEVRLAEASPDVARLVSDVDAGGLCPSLPRNVQLKLNRFAVAHLTITGPDSTLEKPAKQWEGDVPVPTGGAYCLPIPKAIFLGGQGFGISLSAYGSIQKLEYKKSTGVSDAADAAANIAKLSKEPSVADQAASLKAQADLIQQQQRLLLCKSDPPNCK